MVRRSKYTKPMNISSLALYERKNELAIPDVQRDLVWTLSQKQLLIDSLIKDYDIPKLYFREVDNEGDSKYEVIDGQQRINAILDYMDDKYSLPKDSDPFGQEETANKLWSEMSTEFQIEFQNRTLDVVILSGYTEEERDETFLRLQNGTPLKAPEKRRAISGNMRYVVEELAKHKVFKYCGFSDKHFAFQDVTAKALKMIMAGGPTSVTAHSLSKMYEDNKSIESSDKDPRALKKAYNFVEKAFASTANPKLKKYALIDLSVIASLMLQSYDLGNYAEEFGEAYLDFLKLRVEDSEKDEEERDPILVAYANSARGDSLEYVEFRQKVLREYIVEKIPALVLKDENRTFSQDQRVVLYRQSGGKCQKCGCDISENDFEADHIVPWSKGGKTQIENGQALCAACNKEKSNL